MRLRYHKDRENDGLIVLENPPQMRNLIIEGRNTFSNYVQLPYLYFIIRYIKNPNGMFVYPGIYGSGLSLYGSLSPISSWTDSVIFLPTENFNHRGLVCTPHKYDWSHYKSIHELVKAVISMWYGSSHQMRYHPFGNFDNLVLGYIENIETSNFDKELLKKLYEGL